MSTPLLTANAIHDPPTHPQAACLSDLDNDGNLDDGLAPDCAVDVNDLLAFLAGFERGDSRIDLDDGSGDGRRDNAVDVNDLIFMLVHFEAGC